jgi:hypothetical protein
MEENKEQPLDSANAYMATLLRRVRFVLDQMKEPIST